MQENEKQQTTPGANEQIPHQHLGESPSPLSPGIIASGPSEAVTVVKPSQNTAPYLKTASIVIIFMTLAPVVGFLLISLFFGGKTGSEFFAIALFLVGFAAYLLVGPWAIVNLLVLRRFVRKGGELEPATSLLVGIATLIGLLALGFGITQKIIIDNQSAQIRTAGQLERDRLQNEIESRKLAEKEQERQQKAFEESWAETSPEEAIKQLNACNVHAFSYNDWRDNLLYYRKPTTGVMMSGYAHAPKVDIFLVRDGDRAVFDAAKVALIDKKCIQTWKGSYNYGR